MTDAAADMPELPGYYFDKERGKYFRIQAAHNATEESRYTASAIQKEKRKRTSVQSKERYDARLARVRRAPYPAIISQKHLCFPKSIWRSALSENALSGNAGLLREHNSGGKPDQSCQSHAYISGLTRYKAIHIEDIRNRLSIDKTSRVVHFAYDHLTSGLVLGIAGPKDYLAVAQPSIPYGRTRSQLSPEMSSARGICQKYLSEIWAPFESPVSSVNISPQRNIITTTYGASRKPKVWLAKLGDVSEADSTSIFDIGIAVEMMPALGVTIYNSTANTFSTGTDMFAVGMTNEATVVRSNEGGWVASEAFSIGSDVLSLDFQTPHTVALGLRNLQACIWDIRSHTGVARIRHRSSIFSIKRGCETHSLIVAGPKSQMAHYDLRMIKDDVPTMDENSGMKTKTRRKLQGTPWLLPLSKALYKFDYSNEDQQRLGMDVDREKGLIAAGQDDGSIAMYSIRTGKKLKWAGDEATKTQTANPASDVRFFNDYRGQTGLMVARGSSVEYYAW